MKSKRFIGINARNEHSVRIDSAELLVNLGSSIPTQVTPSAGCSCYQSEIVIPTKANVEVVAAYAIFCKTLHDVHPCWNSAFIHIRWKNGKREVRDFRNHDRITLRGRTCHIDGTALTVHIDGHSYSSHPYAGADFYLMNADLPCQYVVGKVTANDIKKGAVAGPAPRSIQVEIEFLRGLFNSSCRASPVHFPLHRVGLSLQGELLQLRSEVAALKDVLQKERTLRAKLEEVGDSLAATVQSAEQPGPAIVETAQWFSARAGSAKCDLSQS